MGTPRGQTSFKNVKLISRRMNFSSKSSELSVTRSEPRTLEGGIYDKYNSDIACSLPGVHKLYNKLIAYQIFEIGFDRRRQCLKIDFEDFNETMAILKKSNWV